MGRELKAIRLQREIDKMQDELYKHQSRCKHKNATGTYGSNTGNYDPSSDCYWINAECPTCLKLWTIRERENENNPEYREFRM